MHDFDDSAVIAVPLTSSWQLAQCIIFICCFDVQMSKWVWAHDLLASSISIMWEFVRNTNPQAYPRLQMRGGGAQQFVLQGGGVNDWASGDGRLASHDGRMLQSDLQDDEWRLHKYCFWCQHFENRPATVRKSKMPPSISILALICCCSKLSLI